MSDTTGRKPLLLLDVTDPGIASYLLDLICADLRDGFLRGSAHLDPERATTFALFVRDATGAATEVPRLPEIQDRAA